MRNQIRLLMISHPFLDGFVSHFGSVPAHIIRNTAHRKSSRICNEYIIRKFPEFIGFRNMLADNNIPENNGFLKVTKICFLGFGIFKFYTFRKSSPDQIVRCGKRIIQFRRIFLQFPVNKRINTEGYKSSGKIVCKFS